jgi:hypothetical protein
MWLSSVSSKAKLLILSLRNVAKMTVSASPTLSKLARIMLSGKGKCGCLN